jgi:hypothetical protein
MKKNRTFRLCITNNVLQRLWWLIIITLNELYHDSVYVSCGQAAG